MNPIQEKKSEKENYAIGDNIENVIGEAYLIQKDNNCHSNGYGENYTEA